MPYLVDGSIQLIPECVVSEWINEQDSRGRTPLHCAVRQDHEENVRLLLESGEANPHIQDNGNGGQRPKRTAYHKARSPAVLQALFDSSAGGDPYRQVHTLLPTGGYGIGNLF